MIYSLLRQKSKLVVKKCQTCKQYISIPLYSKNGFTRLVHPDTVSYHHYYHHHDHHHQYHHDHHHYHHDAFIWSHLSFKLVHTVPQRVLHLQRGLVEQHKQDQ